MKKIVSLIIAFAMVLSLTVFAGAVRDEEPLFGIEFQLVANEPTVEYDEWDIPYNVWNPIPDDTAINPGDTVTMMLSYTVPATVEGYAEVLLSSLEIATEIDGVSELELVEATGCDPLLECNYDIGICFPVPGEYANITHDEHGFTVMADLGSSVTVIMRGVAEGANVTGTTTLTIGQDDFPAQFSLCTVNKDDETDHPSYNAHWSDFMLVQKRDVDFRADENGVYTMFVAKNGHYHRFVPVDGVIGEFIPVDENYEDCGDALAHDDDMYGILSDILTLVVDFFDLSFDQTAFSDETFIGDGEHYTFEYPFSFGAGSVEPPELVPGSGDIDGSGTVTVADAIMTLRAAMSLIDVTPEQVAAADMNGDGNLAVADAIYILRMAMGLIG